MKMNEMYPSKYLKATNLDGDTIATISGVQMESMKDQEGNEESKPVVYFTDMKPMVMNLTNARAIESLYGDDTDVWAGNQVTLFAVEVSAFGKTQPAIRVRDAKAMAMRTNKKTAPPANSNGDPNGSAAFKSFCADNNIDSKASNKALLDAKGNYHTALAFVIERMDSGAGR